MIKSCLKTLIRHLYILMAFVFAGFAAAQDGDLKVSGSVSDPEGAAVSGARVEIRGPKQKIAIADGRGEFEITGLSPGSYRLTVTANGFAVESREITLPTADRIEIKLSIAETAVTVTAEIGQSADRQTVPQNVNILDTSKIFQRSAATMAQVAEVEPGVRMQKTSPTIGGIFVRGLAGKNVNTYVDGVRYTTSAQRGGINTFFNLNEPSNMQTVEILRGSSSAQYGSDALGGTVNMLTRSPKFGADKPEFHGEFKTRFNSSDRSFGGSSMLSYGTDKLGGYVNLAARRIGTLRTADGIDTHAAVTRFLGLPSDILGTRLPDTGFSQYGGAFRLNYGPTDDSQLSFYYARSQQDGGKRYDQLLGGDGNLIADLRNLMLDFGYLRFVKQNLGFFDTASFTVSYNSQREERVNQGGQGDPRGSITHQYERTTAVGFSSFLEKAAGTRNVVVIGGDFYSEGINSPAFTVNPVTNVAVLSRPRVPDNTRYKLAGVFLQDTWDAIPGRLRISGAIRYNGAWYEVRAADSPVVNNFRLWNDDRLTVNDYSANIGATVRLVDQLRLVARYSRGFRAPSMTDLGTLGLTGDGFEVDYSTAIGLGGTIGTTADSSAVSTGLPVARQSSELTNNFDIGLRYRNSWMETSGTYFRIDLNDNIVKQALILPQGAVGQSLGGQPITNQLPNGVVFVPLSTAPVLVRSNYSDAKIFGFEYEFSAKLHRDLRFHANYTFVRAEDKATGLPPNIEGGTPPATGHVSIRYDDPKNIFWVEFFSTLAAEQDRLSTLDISDRRTGATRSRSQIQNFFRRGACVRGLTNNPDGVCGTGDETVLLATGESILQVQNRVLGVGVNSAPMFTRLPGYGVMNLRGGFRVGEGAEAFWSFENMLDQKYRNPSWGIDGAGRSFGLGFKYAF